MMPYTDEEADWLMTGSKASIHGYISTRVFDGIRPLSARMAERLRKKRAKELAERN